MVTPAHRVAVGETYQDEQGRKVRVVSPPARRGDIWVVQTQEVRSRWGVQYESDDLARFPLTFV